MCDLHLANRLLLQIQYYIGAFGPNTWTWTWKGVETRKIYNSSASVAGLSSIHYAAWNFLDVYTDCNSLIFGLSVTHIILWELLWDITHRNMDPIPLRSPGFFFPSLFLASMALREDCRGAPRAQANAGGPSTSTTAPSSSATATEKNPRKSGNSKNLLWKCNSFFAIPHLHDTLKRGINEYVFDVVWRFEKEISYKVGCWIIHNKRICNDIREECEVCKHMKWQYIKFAVVFQMSHPHIFLWISQKFTYMTNLLSISLLFQIKILPTLYLL